MTLKIKYIFGITFISMLLGFMLGKICCISSEETPANQTETETETIICDSEHRTGDRKYFTTNSRFYNQTFQNAFTRSGEYAYSGDYSVKLRGKRPYGMTYRIKDLQAGERFKVSIKRLSADGEGVLVISTDNANEFYLANSKGIPTKKRDWEQLELDFIVPEKLQGKSVKVYPWNHDTIIPVYFDDLEIKYLGLN